MTPVEERAPAGVEAPADGWADIDLDAAPASQPVRGEWFRQRWVRVSCAALAIVSLVVLTGSAPAGPEFGLTWAAPGPDYRIVDDLVYAWGRDDLVARRLDDGALVWRAAGVRASSLQEAGPGVLAVTAGPDTPTPEVLLLDARTGGELGRAAGYLKRSARGGEPAVFCRPGPTCGEVAGIDVRTGDEHWRVRIEPSETVLFARAGVFHGSGADSAVFGVVGQGGRLTLRAAATGAVVGRVTAPGSELALVGDQVLSIATSPRPSGQPGTATVTSLALDGTPRWTRTVRLQLPTEPNEAVRVTDCGVAICLDDGGGVTLLDPATGAVRAAFPGRIVAALNPDLYLVWFVGRPDEPQRKSYLLTPSRSHLEEISPETMVVAATGDRSIMATPGPDGAPVDVWLRAANGETRRLGALPAVAGCVISGPRLVCQFPDPGRTPRSAVEIGVWELPA